MKSLGCKIGLLMTWDSVFFPGESVPGFKQRLPILPHVRPERTIESTDRHYSGFNFFVTCLNWFIWCSHICFAKPTQFCSNHLYVRSPQARSVQATVRDNKWYGLLPHSCILLEYSFATYYFSVGLPLFPVFFLYEQVVRRLQPKPRHVGTMLVAMQT